MRKYSTRETVDFVVVGSGAAGGIVARELSQAGLSVVVMEQGPRMSPADFEHDELKYRHLAGITNDPTKNPQSFRTSPDLKAVPEGRTPLTYARVVGGSSAHFTANFWRFHEIDFNERSVLGPISGTGFADWPISYAELEPYYTKVEWEVGVSGLAGASPFDPPRSKPYPMPPCRLSPPACCSSAAPASSGCIRSRRRWRSPPCLTAGVGLRAVRPVQRLRLRGAREVVIGVDGDP